MVRHRGYFGGARHAASDSKRWLALGGSVTLVAASLIGGIALIYFSGEPNPPAASRPVVVERGPEIAMVDVLVPIRDIESGQGLSPRLFRKESRPKVGVSHGALRSFEELKNQYARTLLLEGQPVTRRALSPNKPPSELTPLIPEGYRAVSIRVNEITSVEGWARAESRVDLHWLRTGGGGASVRPIVQNVKVLSAERQINANAPPGAPAPGTVTLLVTAEDSPRVTLAQATGQITMVLRGDLDVAATKDSELTINDLREGAPAKRTPSCEGKITIGGLKYCIGPRGQMQPVGGE